MPRNRLVTLRARAAMEEVTTESLVSRARRGDREAYGMLFHRYHDEVYRFAARRVGDHHAGQDVAAQTFADAFRAIGRFRWRGAPFEAWLYTIARRRVADQLRARSSAQAPAEQVAVDDHSESVADAELIRRMIERLPETERTVIELRFMEDLDVEQAARRLGKRPGAVRVAQHRALQHLRGMMGDERDGS